MGIGDVDVEIHKCFFLPENVDEFPFHEYDYIVDAVDTVTANTAKGSGFGYELIDFVNRFSRRNCKKVDKKQLFKYAFIKSIPIMCSYLFVSMAYGILMEESGFEWYYSLLVSMSVYTGAFQFVLTTLLSAGASILTIMITALFMNSRQTFYSLSFVDEFSSMGWKKPYMIHTMTDETYAVNCTLELKDAEKKQVMFWVAFLSRCYWMTGAVIGGVLGQIIPFSLEGIDFSMTALFVIIFLDQWEKADTHKPALAGLAVGIISLLIFGENKFMLPALIIVSMLLVWYNSRKQVAVE